jgi:SAUR family protein
LGFPLPCIIRKIASSKGVHVPKGYHSVYVGDEMKWFVIPISYLKKSSFQEMPMTCGVFEGNLYTYIYF